MLRVDSIVSSKEIQARLTKERTLLIKRLKLMRRNEHLIILVDNIDCKHTHHSHTSSSLSVRAYSTRSRDPHPVAAEPTIEAPAMSR